MREHQEKAGVQARGEKKGEKIYSDLDQDFENFRSIEILQKKERLLSKKELFHVAAKTRNDKRT